MDSDGRSYGSRCVEWRMTYAHIGGRIIISLLEGAQGILSFATTSALDSVKGEVSNGSLNINVDGQVAARPVLSDTYEDV